MLKVSPFSVNFGLTSALGDDLTCYLGPWGEIISQIMYLIISISVCEWPKAECADQSDTGPSYLLCLVVETST